MLLDVHSCLFNGSYDGHQRFELILDQLGKLRNLGCGKRGFDRSGGRSWLGELLLGFIRGKTRMVGFTPTFEMGLFRFNL